MPAARAAQYLRMSTEHQRYSTDNQAAAIAAYAEAAGLEIVQTYADEGISGLTLRDRPGLKQLLADVVGRAPGFETILVYDVSRWGRFQDPDQSAHYEYLCREAGVRVEYCAEPFANSGQLGDVLFKQLKRAMAAEFSRDLSRKVAEGQKRLSEKGYWQGGAAPYGLRRVLVDENDQVVMLLERGQHKALQAFRVKLVQGPETELEVVRSIFRHFAITGLSAPRIAQDLNDTGAAAPRSAEGWSASAVRSVLRNGLYCGTFLRGRYGGELGGRVRLRPRSEWSPVENFIEPTVTPELFQAAQRALARRRTLLTREQLLERLTVLQAEKGKVTSTVIDKAEGLPNADVYTRTFGGLQEAYRLIGYRPKRDLPCPVSGPFLERLHELLAEDQSAPPKARRKHAELLAVLRKEGYRGNLATLGRRIRDWRLAQGFSFGVQSEATREQMLDLLRDLLARHGRVSRSLIDAEPGLRSSATYVGVFGSLTAAYALIGYTRPVSLPPVPQQYRQRALELLEARTSLPVEARPPIASLWRTLQAEGCTASAAWLEALERRRRRAARS